MNQALVLIATLLNRIANAVGAVVLAPIAKVPGWLSATVVAFVSGALLILTYKVYIKSKSHQTGARSDQRQPARAQTIQGKSSGVAQGAGSDPRGAIGLLALSLVPIVVMALPVTLLLGQLSLWYQARPLLPGETAVVTVKLKPGDAKAVSGIRLEPSAAVAVETGPVRVRSKGEVSWDLRAEKPGEHKLVFRLGEAAFEKDLAIGAGMMRTSALLPGRSWSDILLYPAEPPPPADSPIESIAIDYPTRSSWTSGADYWVIYWFLASLLAGLLLHKVFGVNL